MSQDESYNQNQNQNLEQGFVEEMMKIGEQTGFPWMEDNNRFKNVSIEADGNTSHLMFTLS